MFMQDPKPHVLRIFFPFDKKTTISPNESNAHFLVKHFQHLLVRAAFEQLTMHLEALDRFGTTVCWAEVEGGVFWGVVGTRRG